MILWPSSSGKKICIYALYNLDTAAQLTRHGWVVYQTPYVYTLGELMHLLYPKITQVTGIIFHLYIYIGAWSDLLSPIWVTFTWTDGLCVFLSTWCGSINVLLLLYWWCSAKYWVPSCSSEMMSVLYNFVKVDTDTFLSIPKYIEIVISMCKAVSSFRHNPCSKSFLLVLLFLWSH